MSFQSRSEFTSAQASEKITLVHVHATARLVVWVDEGGDLFSKDVVDFVSELKLGSVDLTRVDDLGSVVAGTFFFSPQLGKVYIKNASLEDPNVNEMIVTFRLFYSNVTVDATWNLEDVDNKVQYTGLIQSSPGYKQKIGIDQGLTSLVGSGSLVLINDKTFDDIFDKYYFENQLVFVYSWNRDLPFSDSTLLFRGRISNKTFGSEQVSFRIKDNIFDLGQNIPQSVYDDDDTVSDSVKGHYKRWIYGRVDGLQLQSIDQIADGYDLAGTVAVVAGSTTLTGIGTSFLADLSPDDTVFVGTQEFTIEAVASDTSATLSDEPEFSSSGVTLVISPAIPTTVKNRDFLVADHICTELTKTLISVNQLNRVQLSDQDGLLVGDLLEFDTGEKIEIKAFNPDNVVVLVKNLVLLPTVSTDVTRQPVQRVFLESASVNLDDFSITNTSQLTITLDSDVEFNLAKIRAINTSLTFTNASRTITYTGDSLEEILIPRDFIRPTTGTGTFYEILDVSATDITLRVVFDQANTTDIAQYKHPEYIGDTTILSVEFLKTAVINPSSPVGSPTSANVSTALVVI